MLPFAASLCLALLSTSCEKEEPEPSVTIDWYSQAQTTIAVKGEDYDGTVTTFINASVKKTDDVQGQSLFWASSGGRMVYDAFWLSFRFNDIRNAEVGRPLKISQFTFSFPFSSDSTTTTHAYSGTVTLLEKTDDYVVLHFHQLRVSCSFGDFVTEGRLTCELVP